MFGEADPEIGGVFKRENGESIKMIAFSVSKQPGNIQRHCRHILGNTEPPPPYVSEWQREREFRLRTGVITFPVNFLARRRRAEKIRVLGYMVNFGASWGTWSVRGRGGGVGGGSLSAGDLGLFLKNFWGSHP